MSMDSLHSCMSVHHVHALCLQKLEDRDSVGSPELELMDSCGFWELNLRPLEELPVLLTTDLSLQPLIHYHFYLVYPNYAEFGEKSFKLASFSHAFFFFPFPVWGFVYVRQVPLNCTFRV